LCSNEIKIGNITCATGWAKEYGAVARAEAAYFAMVNDRGGINGRKIKFISLDDGCDSQKLTKQLVERKGVLLLFSVLGNESNLAIRSYMNQKQVPQLFLESSSCGFRRSVPFPLDHGFFHYLSNRRARIRQIHFAKQACGANRGALGQR
jgi:branched-chain amino acid transport system substrate-binding protein